MDATRDDAARLLLSQVRALQRMHRAGLQPHYGQLEGLFDCADVLDRQLNGSGAAATVHVPVCCECDQPAIGGTTPQRDLCVRHAAQRVLEAFAADMSAIAPTGGLRP